jgi:hypothetical protein
MPQQLPPLRAETHEVVREEAHEATSERRTELRPLPLQETLALSGTRTSDRSPWLMPERLERRPDRGERDCSLDGDVGEEDSREVVLWVHEGDGVVRRTLERGVITGESTARTEAGVVEVTEVTTAGTRCVGLVSGVPSGLTISSAPTYSRLVHYDRIRLGTLGGNRVHKTAKAHAPGGTAHGSVSSLWLWFASFANRVAQLHPRHHLCVRQAV